MNFNQYVKGNTLKILNTTINISELVSFLQSNAHIIKLSLKNAGIGDKGAEALVKLSNLTELVLWDNRIGDKGVEDLAELTNLTKLVLGWNKFGEKGVKALAKSFYLKYILKNIALSVGSYAHNFICALLMDLYSRNKSVDKFSEDSIKKALFKSARDDYGGDSVKYILTQSSEYPFLINSRDEHGHTLYHYYTHFPEMQTFLFEHGLIPEKETELQNILQDRQSTHRTPVVNQVNFFTKKLVESIKASKK